MPAWHSRRSRNTKYKGFRFTKAPYVLHGMGLDGLEKTPEAIGQLEAKGMSPNDP